MRLQPHRVETFTPSKDRLFIEKVRDIVDLSAAPPDRSLVRRRDSGQRRPVVSANVQLGAARSLGLNRLRREHRTKLAATSRENASINRSSKEIMAPLFQGFRDEAWKEELRTLEH